MHHLYIELTSLAYSIERISDKFQVMDTVYVIIIKLFPLSFSYIVHKNQRLSLQNAVIN
jgi:uncharacterized membrane protein